MSRTSWIGVLHRADNIGLAGCIALFATLVLPSLAAAQITAVEKLYAQALAVPATDGESQAALLYDALRAAQSSLGRSKEEKQLTARIKKDLAQIDPLAPGLLRIQKNGAAQILKSAQKLAGAGRIAAARDLLVLALSLDASADGEVVAEIRSTQAAPNALLLDTFVDASLPYQGDTWNISEAGITSPPPQARAQNVTTMLQSSRTLVGNYILTIEALASPPSATFGIALGIQGQGSSYHLLTLEHNDVSSKLAVDRFAENSFVKLATQPLQVAGTDQAVWLGIEIIVQGGRISTSVDGAAPLVVETGASLDGALGFFLASGNSNSRATSFRHLRIQSIH